MELLYLALIGLFVGLVKGTSGFGSSLVAFPLLVLIYHETDVVIMMISFNVILNLLLLFENKAFEFGNLNKIWVLLLFGSMASLFGFYIIGDLDSQVIKYIAIALILFAIINKVSNFKIRIKDNVFTQAITGIFSGLGNGVASIDGPPVVFFLTSVGADKAKFKNTLATYFLSLGLISVAILISLGKYTTIIIQNTLFISLFAVIGVIVGMIISKRLNEETFSKLIVIILIVLGISMLF